MKLSIVTTLYCSAAHVIEFYRRATAVAQKLAGEDYEMVFVNDGSPDDGLKILLEATRDDGHVVAVDLSRNFGHHRAMMTGLAQARGDKVFLIDSDLEEEPEWLPTFDEEMVRLNSDVVYGIQERRKGQLFEVWSGHLFYKLFNLITSIQLPESITTARLMNHAYVKALLQHQEREIFIAGLWHLTGFQQSPFLVKKHQTSATTYTLRKKIALFVNAVTSFSSAPLQAIFYLGLAILALSVVYTLYIIVHRVFFLTTVSGWTSVIASVWLLGGSIMSSIGVVGIYLAKIYSEVKQRPYSIVRKIYSKE
jgi:putative glycosyltransferase